MLTLITGVPGAGKTLYALNLVKGRAESEKRAVYVNGVSELTLPWEPLDDPQKWAEVPSGSIVVIDEAQRVFRPRGTGSAVPVWVARLETHRHMGLDIVLITQHPMLIDANIRRLVGQHFHVVRRFGSKFATVHEWSSCTDIEKGSLDDSVKHEFRYPVESFGWYKSAEVHTHKVRIPAKFWFLVASPFIIAGLIWWGYQSVSGYLDGSKGVAPEVAKSAPAPSKKGAPGAVVPGGVAAPLTVGQYVAAYAPRLAGLAYTAPVYDEVTKPTRAPVPAACVRGRDRCVCYSQDGTRLAMEPYLCSSIVDNGYFVPFDVKGANGPAPVAAAVAGGSGSASALQSSGGPSRAGPARDGVTGARPDRPEIRPTDRTTGPADAKS